MPRSTEILIGVDKNLKPPSNTPEPKKNIVGAIFGAVLSTVIQPSSYQIFMSIEQNSDEINSIFLKQNGKEIATMNTQRIPLFIVGKFGSNSSVVASSLNLFFEGYKITLSQDLGKSFITGKYRIDIGGNENFFNININGKFIGNFKASDSLVIDFQKLGLYKISEEINDMTSKRKIKYRLGVLGAAILAITLANKLDQ